MKVICAWSGGKDSALACYKAMQQGHNVFFLLNMITQDGKSSMTHGISSELLKVQADAIGIPLVQRKTTWSEYEADFKDEVQGLMKQGVGGVVFGDIDLEEHRSWNERVCAELGVEPLFPLWKKPRKALLEEFVSHGFEAFVVSIKADILEKDLLGQKVDASFITRLSNKAGVDLCGEAGEYHTFVTDGPIFKNRIKLLSAQNILCEGHWFWSISKYSASKKERSNAQIRISGHQTRALH